MAIIPNLVPSRILEIVRRLARTPLFTAITLLTLAIGIGANTVIFSVVESVILKPLAYPHPEELVGVWTTAPGIGFDHLNMAPFLYFTAREQANTIQQIGLYNGDSLSITGAGEPEHLTGLDVTSETLPILGVQPALGRLFTQADDSPGSPETLLLSNGYWQKKFGKDPAVLGRVLQVDGRPRQIIGVLPQGFHFLDQEDVALILPFQLDRATTKLGNFSFNGLARLKPGVTVAQANADMARIVPIAERSFPAPLGFSEKAFESARLAPDLHLLKQDVIGDIGNVLWVLMGSLGLVLFIACANVANLLLVRVEGRRQELAIRSALGAGWKRIAGDLLLESLTLGLTGSLIDLAIAYAALKALVALAPTGLPRIHEIGIDPVTLLFALVLAVFTSLLIGAIPVLKYAGAHINLSLREGGRGQSQSREQHRARNALVILQVALALVLLICSGLMIRTFSALTHVDPGFSDPNSVQTFRISIPESEAKEPLQSVRMQQQIRDRIAVLPGVTAVAMTTALPLEGRNSNDIIFAQDHAYRDGELPPVRRFKFVSPGSFATIGTRLVAGRDLTWDDTYNTVPVVLLSENLAREYWQTSAAALGKRIRIGPSDDWREVIGVVADVHDDGISEPAVKAVYWPLLLKNFQGDALNTRRTVAYTVRSSRSGSAAFVQEMQQAVWSVDSNLPLADTHTLGYLYTKSMARTSFTLILLSVAGAMALLLGVIGIYGVIAYGVAQRTREIGIRMALGAQRNTITALFVRHGLILTGFGIACGLGASLLTMRLMKSLLFNVSPVDPVTYATIPLVIALIAWLACYLPSRKAASIDPVHALRAD